jgi:hypothetical protein
MVAEEMVAAAYESWSGDSGLGCQHQVDMQILRGE